MHTPFFPSLRPFLAPLKVDRDKAASKNPHHLKELFGAIFPSYRLSPADEKANSRNRFFPMEVTFWAFLWQILNPGSSCRDALRHLQSLVAASGKVLPDNGTSAYCQARSRLDLERLISIFSDTVKRAKQLCSDQLLWLGHQVFVVDGSGLLMPDTPQNQKAFPQPNSQKPGCGFPLMRLVVLFCLATGTVVQTISGTFYQGELALFRNLLQDIPKGSVLLADRGFGDYGTLWLLLNTRSGEFSRAPDSPSPEQPEG